MMKSNERGEDSPEFLRELARQSFVEISAILRKGVVFLDRPAAERISWNLGLEYLLGLGVENVFPFPAPAEVFFPSSSSSEDNLRFGTKAIFFITFLSTEIELQIKTLLRHASFTQVIIFTTLPEHLEPSASLLSSVTSSAAAFATTTQTTLPFLHRLADAVNQDIETIAVEIRQHPISYSAFSQHTFFLPSGGDLPLLFDQQGDENNDPSSSYSHSSSLRLKILELSHSFSSFLSVLNVKEDIFAVGPLSKGIAKELKSIPRSSTSSTQTPQPTQKTASVILVDRSLDLAGPMSHSDNLLDQIFELLPSFQDVDGGGGGSGFDVQVDMTSFFGFSSNSPSWKSLPGSLVHPGDKEACSLLDSFVSKKSKDALLTVRKTLIDILNKSKLTFDMSQQMGSVTSNSLSALFKSFNTNNSNHMIVKHRHFKTLQLAVAAQKSILSLKPSSWNEISSLEKVLLLSAEDLTGLAHQLVESFSGPLLGTDRKMFVRQQLQLLVFIYSLLGDQLLSPSEWSEETKLKEALVLALLQPHSPSATQVNENEVFLEGWLGEVHQSLKDFNKSIAEGTLQSDSDDAEYERRKLKLEIGDKVNSFFEILRQLNSIRKPLTELRKTLLVQQGTASYRSLLGHLMGMVVDDKVETIKDLEHFSSSSLSGLLNKGFSRFGFGGLVGPTKVKPSRSGIIVLFVIGGVTAQEIKEVREIVTKYSPGTQLLIGSTGLATSEVLLRGLVEGQTIN